MPAFRNRTGEQIGRLTVIREAAHGAGGKVRWLCRCACGNEVTVRSSDLSLTHTSSCGCLQAERTATVNISRTKHGHAKSGGGNKRLTTPEYRSWKAMLERVRNPNAPNYPLYGGRGITICDQWQGKDGFKTFLADMGNRPDGETLDRIDNEGNYEPGNCQWATSKRQRANQRETPERRAKAIDALNRGRVRMWSDPEIRARLVASRRKAKS